MVLSIESDIRCWGDADGRAKSRAEVRAEGFAVGQPLNRLLHLAVAAELAAASEIDYVPRSFATEGFIHCCWPIQLAGVVERYYQGRDDLVLLTLDLGAFIKTLVEEDSGNGELFPHVYGHIPLSAVNKRSALLLDSAGKVDLSRV
ncbi:MAG: hypothetical protein ACI8PP_002109 [Candidatus Pseudothioglobus sp.]